MNNIHLYVSTVTHPQRGYLTPVFIVIVWVFFIYLACIRGNPSLIGVSCFITLSVCWLYQVVDFAIFKSKDSALKNRFMKKKRLCLYILGVLCIVVQYLVTIEWSPQRALILALFFVASTHTVRTIRIFVTTGVLSLALLPQYILDSTPESFISQWVIGLTYLLCVGLVIYLDYRFLAQAEVYRDPEGLQKWPL